jgi:hypothetical protein
VEETGVPRENNQHLVDHKIIAFDYHNIIALDCHKIIEELIGSAATV